MKLLLILMLIPLALVQTRTGQGDSSDLEIIQFEFKEKMVDAEFSRRMVSERPPVLNPNPNNPPTGASQTSDQATDRFRKSLPSPEHKIKVYSFQMQMKNGTSRSITKFAWAYHPDDSSSDPQNVSDQQFLCNVRIEPGDIRIVKVISPIPRQRVVDVSEALRPPDRPKPSLKDMIINKVEFADGTTWQRTNWNPIILSRQGVKKLSQSKCIAL